MYLKKLELYGFKSFALHTELVFQKGITGIVGPNGSGKSNIADAIRWVLGEQSPRLLRGSKMEDVIFNGTQKRRPLGYCEVIMTFDNADAKLPVDYAEVSVGRRVYRSGEGVYSINKQTCRLRDIVELFRDTGIGKEGYSIISQGRIDEILSPKNENRRLIFEEAAGIVQYRARRDEARRKLEHAQTNLQRIEDILDELESQLGPLEKQSEQARSYLKCAEQLKQLEIGVFAWQCRQNDRERRALAQRLQQQQALQTEAGAQLEALQKRLLLDRQRLKELEAKRESSREQQLQGTREMQAALSKSQQARQRLEFQTQEATRLQLQLQSSAQRGEALELALSQTQRTLEAAREDLQRCETAYAHAQQRLTDAQQEIEAQQGALSARRTQQQQALSALQDTQAEALSLAAERQGLSAKLEAQQQQRAQTEQSAAALQKDLEALETKLCDLSDREASAARLQKQQEQALGALQQQEKLRAEARAKLERRLQEHSAMRRTLESLMQNHEGYFQSVRKALDYAKRAGLDAKVDGVIGDLVCAPEGMETAMEVALGPALQNIVTESDQQAKQMIEHLRANRLGRATFCPRNTMRARALSAQEQQALAGMDGYLGVASDLLEYDARYKGVIGSILGRVVIARDIDAALALARQTRHTLRIVTLSGDVLNPGGSMTGGSRKDTGNGLLQRKRKIDGLERSAAQLQGELEALLAAQRADAQQAERMQQAARERAHAQQEIALQLAAVRQQKRTQEQSLQQMLSEAQALEQSDRTMRQQLQTIEAQYAKAQQQLRRLDVQADAQRITSDQSKMDAALSAREALQQQAMQARVALVQAQNDAQHAQQASARLKEELEGARQGAAQATQALGENAEQQGTLSQSIRTLGEAYARAQEAQKALEAELLRLESEYQGASAALEQGQREREQLQQGAMKLESEGDRLQLRMEKLEDDHRALVQRMWERYEVSAAQAASAPLEMEIDEAKQRVAALKGEIRRMGPVNVGAVEEYAQASARFNEMSEQKKDLCAAKQDLQQLIETLQKRMQQQFKQQFALINESFTRIFQELFEGGWATLKLEDEQDVLNCDIEIVAQPPGKKLQSISLLSGGEKALTAIAILFSMLSLKPTPFCILDEIEAALDDVNVVRFSSYLQRYAEKVQFIVITHRKDSMAASDALYGVTMEEKGVSKLISVRLVDQAG